MTLELYPTLTCNLNCQFCDTTDRHRAPVDELSAERMLAIVDEAADMGVERLFLLGGGEPLLRKRATPAVMARAKAHGMEGILTTNGTLMNKALAHQMVDMGWDEVHVSIDGDSARIHDELRGKTGAFQRTVQNACRLAVLRRRGGAATPRLALHFVLTNLNYRCLTGVVELAAAMGAFRVDFDALIAYTPEQKALELSPDQRQEVPGLAARALERARELGIATTLEHFLSAPTLDRGSTPVPVPEGTGFKGAPCLKAWHYLVVAADGRTSPCCVLAGSGGSVAEASVKDVWLTDPFLSTIREGMLNQQPHPRCTECSMNILAHEAEIRRHL